MVLIPEVPFALHGATGLFAYIGSVLQSKGHCVICVAEGAGQVRWGGGDDVRGGEEGCERLDGGGV